MPQVLQTADFRAWLSGLRDDVTRARLARRVARLAAGAWGDSKGVGGGVTELREHFGPGWRVYVVRRGGDVVVVLGGGDKSTQAADIEAAQAAVREL